MASFPTSLDSITNPATTDKTNSPSHGAQHTLENDILEALEAKVGVDASAVTTSHDYKLSGVTGTDKSVSKTGIETLTNKTINSPVLDNATVTDQFNLNAAPLVMDAGTGTYLVSLLNNQLDIFVANADDFNFTANTFTALAGSTIATNTIAETSAASGVTIDGMTIKDSLVVGASGKGVNNTSLDTAAGALGGVWQDWTPTITNCSGGTLTFAKYIQIGKTVFFRFAYEIGGVGAGGGIAGAVNFTLPVAPVTGFAVDMPLSGTANALDVGAAIYTLGMDFLDGGGGKCLLRAQLATGTYLSSSTNLSSTIPHTWANNDAIYVSGMYEGA